MKHQFRSIGQFHYNSDLFDSLNGETDRGMVLIAGEILSTGLELALLHFMPNKIGKKGTNLFDPSSVLGSFSSRIDISYALGLISKQSHSDLHLIRAIRNEFAHHMFELNLDSQEVANRIGEFKLLRYMLETQIGGEISLLTQEPLSPLKESLDTNRKKFLWEFFFIWGDTVLRAKEDTPRSTFEQWHEDYCANHPMTEKAVLDALLGVKA